MIQYAVAHGRPDWSAFWSEIPDTDYRAIMALRRIEFVGHERDDWRAAVTAFAIQAAMIGGDNGEDRFGRLLALMQHRDPDEEVIGAKEAVGLIRRASGVVR